MHVHNEGHFQVVSARRNEQIASIMYSEEHVSVCKVITMPVVPCFVMRTITSEKLRNTVSRNAQFVEKK